MALLIGVVSCSSTPALGAEAIAIQQLLEQRICPNCRLADADLVHADLRDADLSGANLRRANLSQINLDGANLRNSDLSFTTLRGASMRGFNNCAHVVRLNLKVEELYHFLRHAQ